MRSTVFPRTRARLVELGYPAPLAEALLGLAAALEVPRRSRSGPGSPPGRPPARSGDGAAALPRAQRRTSRMPARQSTTPPATVRIG